MIRNESLNQHIQNISPFAVEQLCQSNSKNFPIGFIPFDAALRNVNIRIRRGGINLSISTKTHREGC